jgi:hypothetical protein
MTRTSDQIYAGDRVAYMNARRDRKPASGGTNYAKRDRIVNKAAERERCAALDEFDLIRAQVAAFFAAQRAASNEFRNQLRSGIRPGDEIPF